MKFHRTIAAGLFVAGLAIAGSAWAGGSTLPPNVDLDPDRGMPFGRLGKTSLQGEVFKPMKDSTRSRAMDPAIDPFNSMLGGGRYQPSSGKIQGSLSDTLREMRRRQEAAKASEKEAEKRALITRKAAARDSD